MNPASGAKTASYVLHFALDQLTLSICCETLSSASQKKKRFGIFNPKQTKAHQRLTPRRDHLLSNHQPFTPLAHRPDRYFP